MNDHQAAELPRTLNPNALLWHHADTGESQLWFMQDGRVTGRATILGEEGNPALIGPPFSIAGVGDIDGDGRADIVWHHAETGETQIWFMDSHRVSSRATVLGEDGNPAYVGLPFRIVGVTDMDGDARADIVWHNEATGETQIWFMDGHRVASRATVLGEEGNPAYVGPPFRIVGVGDMDGDGRGDIVWHHDDTGETQIWYLDGQRVTRRMTVLGEEGNPAYVGLPFRIVGVGDMDDNGHGDIVWHHDDTGETQIWSVAEGRVTRRIVVFGEDGQAAYVGPPFSIAGIGRFNAVHVPPGRICRSEISLDFLQRKFDLFFNQRPRPLFQLRLDSPTRQFGQTTLSIAMDDGAGYNHDDALVRQELAGPGESFEVDEGLLGTHRAYFHDLNSTSFGLEVASGPVVTLKTTMRFETEGGIELKVEDSTGQDIDFTWFGIDVALGLQARDGSIDGAAYVDEVEIAVAASEVAWNPNAFAYIAQTVFRGEKMQGIGSGPDEARDALRSELRRVTETVHVGVSVDGALPDGAAADGVSSTITGRLWDALALPDNRAALGHVLTRWLVGGDYYVLDIAQEGEKVVVNYVVPPGQPLPFPELPQEPLDPGPLAPIEHIVVLMMENRSFDHMLGYLSKEGDATGVRHTDIDGLKGGESNVDAQGRRYESAPLAGTVFAHSPDHSFQPVLNQISGGRMDGFVSSFIAKYPEDADPGAIMGYYTAAQLPVYDALAREFAVCDRWFAAHPGPTFCNRFYTLTGRLNRDAYGRFEFDNFSGDAFKPVQTRTLFDHLSERGVSWRYFEQRYCTLRLYARHTFNDTQVVDFDDGVRGFEACALAGTLPAVSFIDPNFIDETDGEDNDDGAPGDVRRGQRLVGRVVNALMKGPRWDRTLLVITYDEHGGFFDHVNPLAPVHRETALAVSDIDHYGARAGAHRLALGRPRRGVPCGVRPHFDRQDHHSALHGREPARHGRAGRGSQRSVVADAHDPTHRLARDPGARCAASERGCHGPRRPAIGAARAGRLQDGDAPPARATSAASGLMRAWRRR